MDCIFCKIVNGEIPAYKVYENENVLAFLDISQNTKGHTLIIPKAHHETVYDLDATTAHHVFSVVPTLSRALKDAFHPIGLNVISNNQRPYQSVDHFHIHLLPRYEKDGLTIAWQNHQSRYDDNDYHAVADAVKNALK